LRTPISAGPGRLVLMCMKPGEEVRDGVERFFRFKGERRAVVVDGVSHAGANHNVLEQ